jgi:hypothetical protein
MTHSGGRDSRDCRRIGGTSQEVSLTDAPPDELGSVGGPRGVGAGRGGERDYKGSPQLSDCVRMVHLRRDFQAMIDRHDEGSVIGAELLGASDRLFHWWHKVRGGTMAWSTFLGYARPIRWGVGQALGRGASCPSARTAATCRELLAGEAHL